MGKIVPSGSGTAGHRAPLVLIRRVSLVKSTSNSESRLVIDCYRLLPKPWWRGPLGHCAGSVGIAMVWSSRSNYEDHPHRSPDCPA
jgi:hypothetical protein